jgi:uncharacterized DUF497 family protein
MSDQSLLLTCAYNICILYTVHITWDLKKAEINFKKHRIRFSDAETVLYDPFAMTLEEQDISDEQRFVTVGSDANGQIIVVVYSYRADAIRLISARKATPKERKQYEKGI